MARASIPLARFVGSGAGAGALSALVFSAVHHLLISPIWFALGANLVAGAVSGASLAWSYGLAVSDVSRRSWGRYNASFAIILLALAATSMVVFEPVTTIAALLQAKAPPRALIGRALPVTLIYTFATALLLCVRYRAGWLAGFAVVVTAFVIVSVLGLNLSILGLVAVPGGSVHVLGEALGLIVGLAAVYGGSMAFIWRHQLIGGRYGAHPTH